MRLLVLGGTFNPLHLGHLMLAEELAAEFGYDRIVLVPSFIPPHKAAVDDPGPSVRLGMARAAVAGDTAFMVSACETERGGLSYTIDTLERVVADYSPEGKPGLVIGDDLVAGFGTWRDPEGICERADLIVARRSGEPFTLLYPHRAAHNMLLPISSTDIRARIASGRPWRRLVPAAVSGYIDERGIYGEA